MRLTFKSTEFEKRRWLSIMWIGFIQSTKGLIRKSEIPKKREFCKQMAFRLELQHRFSCGSPACLPSLQVLDSSASTSMWGTFLKSINQSLINQSISPSLSGELWLLQCGISIGKQDRASRTLFVKAGWSQRKLLVAARKKVTHVT